MTELEFNKHECREMIVEYRDAVVDLFHENTIRRCIPKQSYEEDMRILLTELLECAILYRKYSLCRKEHRLEYYRDYYIQTTHFFRHINGDIWHILSAVYDMLDEDDYEKARSEHKKEW